MKSWGQSPGGCRCSGETKKEEASRDTRSVAGEEGKELGNAGFHRSQRQRDGQRSQGDK